MQVFSYRSIWRELHVPMRIVHSEYQRFFESEKRDICDKEEAVALLKAVVSSLQNELVSAITDNGVYWMLFRLYFIFDEVNFAYRREKKIRQDLSNYSSSNQVLEQNRNIERNIIDACNIWLENTALLQKENNGSFNQKVCEENFVFDGKLAADLYIYGLCSLCISLLTLSKKQGVKERYTGISIDVSKEMPFNVIQNHPVIYFNPLLAGNQDSLKKEFSKLANNDEWGQGFKKTFGVSFLRYISVLRGAQNKAFREDEHAIRTFSGAELKDFISNYVKEIDAEKFISSFVLTKDKLTGELKNDESIIWKMGSNKFRHELMPFLKIDDHIIASYQGLMQSIEIWITYYTNGGSCYTSETDDLIIASKKVEKELSDRLVDQCVKVLNINYPKALIKKNVDYKNIFGQQNKNYGDYDVLAFIAETQELYLIEAKYFSDSYNGSGMVNDFNKMYSGYYEHCRNRYELVKDNPDKIKEFLGTTGKLKIYTLFVSSKPLEMELQDESTLVTFVPVSLLDRFIKGRYIDENDKVVKPFITI